MKVIELPEKQRGGVEDSCGESETDWKEVVGESEMSSTINVSTRRG